jgi:hypothetical protein
VIIVTCQVLSINEEIMVLYSQKLLQIVNFRGIQKIRATLSTGESSAQSIRHIVCGGIFLLLFLGGMLRTDFDHYANFEWKGKGQRKDEERESPLFLNSYYMPLLSSLRPRCPLLL